MYGKGERFHEKGQKNGVIETEQEVLGLSLEKGGLSKKLGFRPKSIGSEHEGEWNMKRLVSLIR